LDIQGAFSARYPFLKIDFLETDKATKTPKSTKIDPSTSLKKIINAGATYKIDINDRRTVSEISHEFENKAWRNRAGFQEVGKCLERNLNN
jgi:hypothetical protein